MRLLPRQSQALGRAEGGGAALLSHCWLTGVNQHNRPGSCPGRPLNRALR